MNKVVSSFILLFSFIWSTSASAYIIQGSSFNGTDVGNLDTLLAQTTGLSNSNPVTETNWVNSILDPDTTYASKTNSVTYYATESATVFAFQLQSEPGYFLIKNSKWWALLLNNANSNWGVVDFALLDKGFKLPDLKSMTISHVTEFGKYAPPVKVPESSSLVLFGLGLLGLCIIRKRNKS